MRGRKGPPWPLASLQYSKPSSSCTARLAGVACQPGAAQLRAGRPAYRSNSSIALPKAALISSSSILPRLSCQSTWSQQWMPQSWPSLTALMKTPGSLWTIFGAGSRVPYSMVARP